MTDANANSAAAAASGTTPGWLLKSAREEQGLSVVEVAARLCLSVQFIEDLERNEYSQMRARVYARGHLMSYAHLLGVPEAKLLSALANVKMEFLPESNLKLDDKEHSIPIYQSSESSQQRPSLMLWGSVLILIIVVGLVMMWWKGPSATSTKPVTPATDPTSVNIQPQGPVQPKPATPATPALPPPSSSAAPSSSVAPVSPVVNNSSPSNSPPTQNGLQQHAQAQDQSTLQPSEFSDASRDQSSQSSQAVALPPPRASSRNVEE